MAIDPMSTKPIYIQISEWIEEEILAERLKAEDKVYSQYQLAEIFNINPATAGKGLTILLERDILYKKRGLGMFVTEHAKQSLLATRRNDKLANLVKDVIEESRRLAISDEELLSFIQKMQGGKLDD